MGGMGLGMGVGSKGLLGYDGTHIYGIGCFRGGCSPSIYFLGWRLTFTFLQLSIVDGIFNSCPTIT